MIDRSYLLGFTPVFDTNAGVYYTKNCRFLIFEL